MGYSGENGQVGQASALGVAKAIDVCYSNLWRNDFSRVVRGKSALKQLRIECDK